MASETNDSVINGIEEGILIIDKDYNVLSANGHMLSSLNLDERDVVGKPCYEVARCNPPGEKCSLSELLKTGESTAKRRTYLDKSGSKIRTEVAVHLLTGDKNNGKFIHVERDVTERVRVEMELKEYIATLNERVAGTVLKLQKKKMT